MVSNFKELLAGTALVMLSGAVLAQAAPTTPTNFTLSDNGDANIPALITQSSAECGSASGISSSSYDILTNSVITTTFLNSNLAMLIVPDKSARSAETNDVKVRFVNSSNIISGLVECEGGTVTTNASPLVYKINLDTGKNCNLLARSSDGVHFIEGTLSKSGTGTDTTYAVVNGKCTYDAASSSAPSVVNIKRKTPTTETTTDSSVTWTVEFSEDVTGVDKTDFEVTGATGMTLAATANAGAFGYEVTASGGDFNTEGQAAFLKLASTNDIKEKNGTQQSLSSTTPTGSNDNYYCYESCTAGTTTGKNTKVETSKGILTSLKEEDGSTFTTGKPDNLDFNLGTYSYKVENLTAGDTVTITLTLTNDVPSDAKIYKVTSTGYTELGSANNLTVSGKTIKFDITDGGALDADGDATNGVIVDPVTIGTSTSSVTTATTSNGGGGAMSLISLLFGGALLGLAAYRRRSQLK